LRSREAASVQSTFELIKKGWNQFTAGISKSRPAKAPRKINIT